VWVAVHVAVPHGNGLSATSGWRGNAAPWVYLFDPTQSEEGTVATASGTFEVTSMNEDPYHEAEGEPRLTRANGTQRFTGDVDGTGSVEWLFSYGPDGGARFLGIQRIEGILDGRRGSFVIEAAGNFDGSASKGSWTVIPGTGTGGLVGIIGAGDFEASSGPKASYHLDYDVA